MTGISYNYKVMNSDTLLRKHLSLDRLLSFAAVAKAGSIAGVAGGDASRQALISRQISELSSHFETELTRRAGRGLELTESGKRLARLVHEFESGLQELRQQVRGEPASFRLASSNSVLQWLISPHLQAVNRELPNVNWTLKHEHTEAIEERVLMGEIDFGLSLGWQPGGHLRGQLLGSFEYALFAPAALAEESRVEALLRGVPLALPIGGRLRGLLEEWAGRRALHLCVRVEVDSYLQSAELVRQGTHAAVLPQMARCVMPPGVQMLKLPAQVAQKRKLWLIWRDRLLQIRPEAGRIVEVLVRHFTEHQANKTKTPR